MKQYSLWIVTAALLAACGNTPKKERQAAAPVFKPVEIPVMLNTPAERQRFVARHFWDNFDFADTAYLSEPALTEQAIADYVHVLRSMPEELGVASVARTMQLASTDRRMYDRFTDLFEKYLYDPNSPVRSETLYIPVLESMAVSDHLDSLTRLRPVHRLEMARKNRPGSKAADFSYTTGDGRTGTLYTLPARRTILFFNNPGCHACKEYTGQLDGSPVVGAALANKTLQVLALYPDENIREWTDYQPHMPKAWINGYDRTLTIRDNELYDLRAIPTLYLIDADRTVLLKDVTFPEIEEYLTEHHAGQ